ncbi:MAG: UDP-N-acetylmuramoyl-L-alanyl-D-glutamate--2,6-diaminopimelate ligase, partial [Pseudomonadota bacterium]|nr:UDP-N-acetylmuramoyl-L-alanyl-D-glutamate--2,6-diaminopimelate ligase [Pseudomonadota bacterium]
MEKTTSCSVNLGYLLEGFYKGRLGSLSNLLIKGISLDSREVNQNFIFCALQGKKVNGNHFIEEAFKKGAVVCLTDSKEFENSNILYLKDLKKNLGIISSKLFNHPTQNLETFAVTGTNGKTSCVEFISQIAKLIGYQCGYISTIGTSLDGKNFHFASSLTTPDPITLQRYFHEMVQKDTEQVAFEASSHGLEQFRVVGTSIDTAILTSFSQDHLDYHKNIRTYKNVKKKLFTELRPKNIILNIDNILGKEIYRELQKGKESCSFFTVSSQTEADFHYSFSRTEDGFIDVDLKTPEKQIYFSLSTVSKPLASNVICSLAAFLSRGFNLDKAYPYLKDLNFPKGRMDQIFLSKNDKCFIDYAHTPEALGTALAELKDAYKKSNLWCIFGCGGERDRDKRPKMGQVAESLSDFLVITNDNPRAENDLDIIEEISRGIKNKTEVKIIPNRKEAILYCLNKIKTNDKNNILLIAGKGHEDYQEVLGKRVQFSDHQHVKDFLE